MTTALAGLDGMKDLDLVGGVEKEEGNLSMELPFVKPYLEFAGMDGTINSNLMVTCTDEHLMKAVCLAHSFFLFIIVPLLSIKGPFAHIRWQMQFPPIKHYRIHVPHGRRSKS